MAANGWVKADFAREQMMQADMRDKEREARTATEAAEKAKEELATAKMELEENKDQDVVDRQLTMALLAANQ